MTYTHKTRTFLIFNILKWSKNSVRAGQPGPAPVFLSYLPYFLSRFLPCPKSWHLWLHHMSSQLRPPPGPGQRGEIVSSLRQHTMLWISTCECGKKAIKNYLFYSSFFRLWNVLTLRTCLCARVISCPLPLFSDPHQSRLCHDIISHLTPHSSVLEIRILITSPQPQTESQDSSCCRDLMPVCYVLSLESFQVS